jgi:hypothetical protein
VIARSLVVSHYARGEAVRRWQLPRTFVPLALDSDANLARLKHHLVTDCCSINFLKRKMQARRLVLIIEKMGMIMQILLAISYNKFLENDALPCLLVNLSNKFKTAIQIFIFNSLLTNYKY